MLTKKEKQEILRKFLDSPLEDRKGNRKNILKVMIKRFRLITDDWEPSMKDDHDQDQRKTG